MYSLNVHILHFKIYVFFHAEVVYHRCTAARIKIPLFPPNVKWILAQSEGEIVFDHACDLGFHSSCFAKWTGCIRGPERSTLQSALKRPARAQKQLKAARFLLSPPPWCRATVTCTGHVRKKCVSGSRPQIKTIMSMERGQSAYGGVVTDMRAVGG